MRLSKYIKAAGRPGGRPVQCVKRVRKNTLSLRTSVATLMWPFPRIPSGHTPPDFSENYRQGAKAPLADQGWCSAQRIKIEMIASGNHTIIRAAPVRTLGLRGSELSRSDNPSVMALRETAMTAPFTQGSQGCSRTSAFCQYSFSISRTWVRDFPWALAMAAKSSYSDFSRQTP